MFHLIRSYRWYVLLAMIVGLGLALLLFTPLKHIADFGTESAAVTPSEIENFAGLTLPASTRNLQVHYSAFQDQLLYTRFDLPSSDLPAFVASVAWGELLLPLPSCLQALVTIIVILRAIGGILKRQLRCKLAPGAMLLRLVIIPILNCCSIRAIP